MVLETRVCIASESTVAKAVAIDKRNRHNLFLNKIKSLNVALNNILKNKFNGGKYYVNKSIRS
jgi:hypothetical protein